MDPRLERVVPQAGGEMADTTLLIQELRALREEMHNLRLSLTEFKGEAAVIKAEMGHMGAEIASLWAKVETQEATIAALKAAPGQTAIRWVDAIGLALVTAALLALGGIAWTLGRPASGAVLPAVNLQPAHRIAGPH